MTPDADRDLQHFLKLALAQVRHRIEQLTASLQSAPGANASYDQSRLRLLEELLKEQITNENSDSAARPAR